MGVVKNKMALYITSCCQTQEEYDQRLRSKEIDKQLANDKQRQRREVKILLLGSGESGKSTFLKQMKIIHGDDFDEEQISEYKLTIYQNIIKGTMVLIDARDKLYISWGDPSNIKHGHFVFKFQNNQKLDTQIFLEFVPSIRQLWSDKGIQEAFERRREFQLGDSVKYFADNLDRIGTIDYMPTKLDILHARKATKGIIEHLIDIKGIPFKFVDVGGQRSQRQKWFQCFDGVTSILFLVSSSEYDQALLEDRVTNRLVESRHVFETVVNNRCFSRVSIILFLNKTDLLEEKLKHVSFKDYFPEFPGNPHNLVDVQKYLFKLYESARHERVNPLFHHFTTAIDTENIKLVFQAVRDTILQDNLKSLMLQ